MVRRAINERVTGRPDEWPLEWFQFEHCPAIFDTGLSIGCGSGGLERDVRRKDLCRRVVGIDISAGALESADNAANDEGLDGISYVRADFNRLDLPVDRFDVVFFHQSMHHVAELEHCIGQVRRSVKPGGFLYLDEYVGPSRDEWSGSLLSAAQRAFARVPREFRRVDAVPLPIVQDDPSEAIRSSEILPLVAANFEVVARRDYGGNLLSLIHPLVRWESMEEAPRAYLLRELIRREDGLLRSGVPSYYSVIVARR
jgi:SAM-dependent methyltransferase